MSEKSRQEQNHSELAIFKPVDKEKVKTQIFEIRGLRVMLDRDIAEYFGVETKPLNRAMKRNVKRFPANYCLQLTRNEYRAILRCQSGTLELEQGQYSKYLPYCYSESGVAMLTSVLHTEKAIEASIQIIDAFVEMSHYLRQNAQLLPDQEFQRLESRQSATEARVDNIEKKMITKEEAPDSGKIIIGGIDLDYTKKRDIPNYRRRIGVVFQDYKLLPARTVFENVAFALEIAGMSNLEIEKTVPKVLEMVGLADKGSKFPDQLSGGEQQRVSIARAIARQPKVLIADEPTGNLDKLTRQEIIDLLKKINDYGTTVLVTTHDESIVNHLMKRVITLKEGKIVSDQKQHGIYRLDSDNDGMNGIEFRAGILERLF